MNNGDKKMRARRRNANIAYACYLWIAFVLIVSGILEWIFGDPESSNELATLQGVGMMIILPLSLAAIVAAIFGVESSLKLWAYWRSEIGLLLLPVLLAVFIGAFVMVASHMLARIWLAVLAALHAVAAILFALHGFLTPHTPIV